MWASPLIVIGLSLFGRAAAQEKERPVSKIITMLKDMLVQMEKEAEEDDDIYEAMVCWCETNDKLKTQAIADAKSKIDSLTAAIEEFTANSARLNTEIANLDKEISKNGVALDQAQAIRAKNSEEFIAEEKDMLQSIGSMKAAIVALSKHNKGASFMQISEDDAEVQTADVLASIKNEATKHASLLSELTTPGERTALKAFVQSGTLYAPQSGEIFGILEAMKESFETNLAASQKQEASEQSGFADLKTTKEAEIKAGQDQVDAKTTELGDTDLKNAQSKQDLEDTTTSLAEDTKFLADLKDKCANMDQEFEERTKTRTLEMAAVSKALEYLSSDEAHALFTKTFNPSMLQRESTSRTREQVVKVLQRAAKQSRDPRLSTLAVGARMDAFGNLKKTIQTMVDRLLKEKEDEIKHKDFCVEQLNENARATEVATQSKNDAEAKIAEFKAALDVLDKEIAQLKADVVELNKQAKMAGEDREKANKDFQVILADQRATQKLVGTALGVLKGFYEKAALLQKDQKAAFLQLLTGQAPPPGFKSYEKNKQSGGVMGMMQGVIDDAKAMEADAIRAEDKAQKEYEEFVQDTNDTVEEKKKEIANKSQVRNKTDAKMLDEEVNLDQIMSSLDQLATENGDIHRSCDFVLKNWEVRTAARDAEVEALKQAIALFSGAKMAALLQHY